MTIDTSTLVAEYGAFYLNHGQGVQDLKKLMLFSSKLESQFTRANITETIRRSALISTDHYVQGFQKVFTLPNTTLQISTQEIPLFKVKEENGFYPDDLDGTWMGFLASVGKEKTQYPFVQWVLENHLIPKRNENFAQFELYHGSRVAPTPGTPTTKGQAINGIKKIIETHVADGLVVPIVTGAWSTTPATFVDQIKTFCDALPLQYAQSPEKLTTIRMNPTLFNRYRDGMRIKYNGYYSQATDLTKVIDREFMVEGFNEMIGSNKIYVTTKGNERIFYNSDSLPMMKDSLDYYRVDFITNYWVGLGFDIAQEVFCNELA